MDTPTRPTTSGATPVRTLSHALVGGLIALTAWGVPGDAPNHTEPGSPARSHRPEALTATALRPVLLASVTVRTRDDEPEPRISEPDRVANHLGGIAARLHTADDSPIAGHVFLLMGSNGSANNARLYDQTPYTHDYGDHPDTIASNLAAVETVRTITRSDVELIKFTGAPGGGPSGGITRAIAYLNVVSDGAFTGELRVAATGRLEADGHLGSIDHIDAKTAAAHLANADVMFTPTTPTTEARATYGARFVGELVRDPSTDATLHDPHRLEQFHRWGANRPDGMDIVDARHLIDVASYLCGTGSTYACHITDLLDQQAQQRHDQLQDQVRSESERFRVASQQSSSSDTDAA